VDLKPYLSPIIGTGAYNDPYRPKIATYGVPWAAVIAGQPNGAPKFAWSLVVVAANNTAALDADSELLSFANVTTSTRVSTLSNQEKNRIQSGVSKMGIPLTLTNYATIGDFLDAVGKTQNPTFSLAALNVGGGGGTYVVEPPYEPPITYEP